MKIDNITQLAQARAVREDRSGEETAGATAAGTAETASSVSHLGRAGADSSRDIDTARVEELRRAIVGGRLEIRTDRIADGLIDSLRELLQP